MAISFEVPRTNCTQGISRTGKPLQWPRAGHPGNLICGCVISMNMTTTIRCSTNLPGCRMQGFEILIARGDTCFGRWLRQRSDCGQFHEIRRSARQKQQRSRAAERPDRPETTHYAHNFFAHYRKALGFAVKPLATRFWNGTAEWIHSLAAAFRAIYTGNGQTYALHIVLFLLVWYLLMQ